jgi:hypothetical protein
MDIEQRVTPQEESMAKAKKVTLFTLTLPNKVGQLAALSEALADANVNIAALAGAEAGANAEIFLVTDKKEKARKALADLGAEVSEVEAVRVDLPNKPGRLHKAVRKIADAGVSIRRSWVTAFAGKTATCVLVTTDNAKAIAILGAKKD